MRRSFKEYPVIGGKSIILILFLTVSQVCFAYPQECLELESKFTAMTSNLNSDKDPGDEVLAINSKMNSVLDNHPECNGRVLAAAEKMSAAIKEYVKRGKANEAASQPKKMENSCEKHAGKKWEYEQCIVPRAKANIAIGKSYWLVDFKNKDEFANRSLKMAKNISTLKDPASSPFCMAIFLNSPRVGKDVSMICAAEFTSNGYDKSCKAYTVNLGTRIITGGSLLANGKGYSSTKCDQQTILTALKMGGSIMLQGELYNGGVPGDLGVYIYRDDFGVINAWLEYMGEVNKPKNIKNKGK